MKPIKTYSTFLSEDDFGGGVAAPEHPGAPAPMAVSSFAAELTASVQNLNNLLARHQEDLQQLMIDNAPIARMDPLEHKLQQRAVDAVLLGTTWRSSADIGTRADATARNKHALANRWLKDKRVFAIERRGAYEFPDYAFDPLGQPIPALREILAILEGYAPFRLATWFESPSSALDGRRPRELLATHPALVREAARVHAQGPLHG
nr:antitoxin Xre/MbcA/ParS toxin-binding domain-containing protein [uncultured Albidiferax sp.]